MRSKTEADYVQLASRRKVRWVGSELPEDVLTPTLWLCSAGHTFRMRYANLRAGRSCPYCNHTWRRSRSDYERLAAFHGLTWLAQEPPANIRAYSDFQLPDGRIAGINLQALETRVRPISTLPERDIELLLADFPPVAERPPDPEA